jgi:hypothetical protein
MLLLRFLAWYIDRWESRASSVKIAKGPTIYKTEKGNLVTESTSPFFITTYTTLKKFKPDINKDD